MIGSRLPKPLPRDADNAPRSTTTTGPASHAGQTKLDADVTATPGARPTKVRNTVTVSSPRTPEVTVESVEPTDSRPVYEPSGTPPATSPTRAWTLAQSGPVA